MNQYRIRVERRGVTRKTSVEASTVYNHVNVTDILNSVVGEGSRAAVEVQRREAQRQTSAVREKGKAQSVTSGESRSSARFSTLWRCALEAVLA